MNLCALLEKLLETIQASWQHLSDRLFAFFGEKAKDSTVDPDVPVETTVVMPKAGGSPFTEDMPRVATSDADLDWCVV